MSRQQMSYGQLKEAALQQVAEMGFNDTMDLATVHHFTPTYIETEEDGQMVMGGTITIEMPVALVLQDTEVGFGMTDKYDHIELTQSGGRE